MKNMLTLTKEEIVEITKRRRPSAQCGMLEELGLDFKKRPTDGFPIVSREHFLRVFDSAYQTDKQKPKAKLNLVDL